MKGTVATVGVLAVCVIASCNGDDSATVTSTSAPATTTVATPTTTTTTTAPIPTPTTTTTTTATTTIPTIPTTTTTTTATTVVAPTECGIDEAIGIAAATAELARLEPADSAWRPGARSDAFGERTNEAVEFGARVAFTCAEQLVQQTDGGAERLALVAWNDVRHAAVLQATDAPTVPYRTDVVFQLFIEQPYGEWLEDQFVWAATMSGGESIVIATHDYSAAITAKSWQSEVPRFEDLPVTLEAEQFAIDALLAVGARNVSVAEPAPVGYPIGTIQFNTPLALGAFAVIGPADSFDPMVPIVPDGESSFSTVGGAEIRLTVGKELGQFDLYETGWTCGDHSWRLYSGLGTPAELLAFTELLVRSSTCT